MRRHVTRIVECVNIGNIDRPMALGGLRFLVASSAPHSGRDHVSGSRNRCTGKISRWVARVSARGLHAFPVVDETANYHGIAARRCDALTPTKTVRIELAPLGALTRAAPRWPAPTVSEALLLATHKLRIVGFGRRGQAVSGCVFLCTHPRGTDKTDRREGCRGCGARCRRARANVSLQSDAFMCVARSMWARFSHLETAQIPPNRFPTRSEENIVAR
ncbi:hypothetical protein QFZ98_004758 [Paraburkholderia youngii]